MKSKCCNARVNVLGVPDYGFITLYIIVYECDECKKPLSEKEINWSKSKLSNEVDK